MLANVADGQRRDGPPQLVIRRKLAAVQRRIDRAAAVVTVSQFTADDVRCHLDLKGKPVHVVPNCMAPPPAASAVRPGFLTEGPFLLAVGNMLAHKNFHVLIGLMERLPGRRLVIAGQKATPYGAAIVAAPLRATRVNVESRPWSFPSVLSTMTRIKGFWAGGIVHGEPQTTLTPRT